MTRNIQAVLRTLPSVAAAVHALRGRRPDAPTIDQELLTFLARRVLNRRRQSLLADPEAASPLSAEEALDSVVAELDSELTDWRNDSGTRRVVNGAGVIIHTGLGRSVLPAAARRALERAAGYVLLEVDRRDNKRRKRDAFLEELICHLTGAEAATVVNNNAAATILSLGTLASGKEVICSRSQMVEIGGSFRMPDVMEASGCQLREVGTTNKSYPRDYEGAIGENTGALMLVHTSNYRIVGFTEHPGIEELATIGRRHGIPIFDDLGSGCLLAPESLRIGDEPPVSASVKAGADVTCFSGDKLIGGSQAGIIVGKKRWIQRIRKNPLARAFRIDKMTCLALEATLRFYLEPSRLFEEVPTLRMLRESESSVAKRAEALAGQLQEHLGEKAEIGVVASASEMGSGALPAVPIPTACVSIRCPRWTAQRLATALRCRHVPIFSRLKDDLVLLDARTLQPGDEAEIVRALVDLLSG